MRVHRGLSRHQVADAVGISDDRIQILEQGKGTTNGLALLRLIHFIDASYEQVTSLLEDESATIEQAAGLARAWVSRPAATGAQELTADEATAELFELALRRTAGDRGAARRLLLRALDESLREI